VLQVRLCGVEQKFVIFMAVIADDEANLFAALHLDGLRLVEAITHLDDDLAERFFGSPGSPAE
jgi:hypothetical protein